MPCKGEGNIQHCQTWLISKQGDFDKGFVEGEALIL